MTLSSFKEKLSKCNPRLYVDTNHRIKGINSVYGSSGIYLREYGDKPIDSFGVYGQSKINVDRINSAPDKYVGWCTHDHIPEGDKFDLATGDVVAQGWRTIIKKLVKDGHIVRKRASKYFGWYESAYDRLGYEGKLKIERKEKGLCLQQLPAIQEMN